MVSYYRTEFKTFYKTFYKQRNLLLKLSISLRKYKYIKMRKIEYEKCEQLLSLLAENLIFCILKIDKHLSTTRVFTK